MQNKVGIYAGFLLDERSNQDLNVFCESQLGLNLITSNNPHFDSTIFHVTLLSSYDSFISHELLKEKIEHKEITVTASHWEIFYTKQNTSCLVLVLNSDMLIECHNNLVKSSKITHSHGQYTPHISIHYDYKLRVVPDIKPNFPLTLVNPFTKIYI